MARRAGYELSSIFAPYAPNCKMAHVRQQLSFSLYHDFEDLTVFKPDVRHEDAAGTLFDQLETWARAFRSIRAVGLFE